MQAVQWLSPALLPRFADATPATQRAWVADCSEAAWAAAVGAVSLLLLLSSSTWTQALHAGERALAPLLLICASTGLWASHLADLVQLRLAEARPKSVLHTTMLLALFGAAAFKREHTGLLAMTLPALLCHVPALVRAGLLQFAIMAFQFVLACVIVHAVTACCFIRSCTQVL